MFNRNKTKPTRGGLWRRRIGIGFFAMAILIGINALVMNFADTGSNVAEFSPATLIGVSEVQAAQAATQDAAAASEKSEPLWVVQVLRDNPVLAIFLTLALGYWIGAFKMGHFSLGAVTATLLIGVVIGQLDIEISSQVKTMFFTMFLFAVGYSVGPQFVRGVARDGLPQAIFAVLICVICFVVTYGAAKMAGLDIGMAAGFWAGAQTISASIGLATDAINHAGMADGQEMINKMPIAYAITYLFGTIGTGVILAQIGPKLIGANLEQACKDYEARMSQGAPAGGMGSAWHQLSMRAFQVPDNSQIVGKSIKETESLHQSEKLFIERIKRQGEIIDFNADTQLKAGDIVAVSGKTEALIALEAHATEVADSELLNIPVETIDLVITNKKVDGEKLIELATQPFARGVFLNKITRGASNVDIPVLAQTTLHRGDILTISGSKAHTARVEKELGYADRTTDATDMVWVGLFIVLFGLIGALTATVGGVPLTLSVSGGVLIGGLILGWLRSVHPTFGRLPIPTQWFMNSVGLNVFIAIVGISAGPGFIEGLKESGSSLFLWGVVATGVPMLLAPLIGKYLFKFDPAINLGICGGARTSTASVAMVGDVAKSNIPMLGYTVPYAVSNTLLTLIGMIMVITY